MWELTLGIVGACGPFPTQEQPFWTTFSFLANHVHPESESIMSVMTDIDRIGKNGRVGWHRLLTAKIGRISQEWQCQQKAAVFCRKCTDSYMQLALSAENGCRQKQLCPLKAAVSVETAMLTENGVELRKWPCQSRFALMRWRIHNLANFSRVSDWPCGESSPWQTRCLDNSAIVF